MKKLLLQLFLTAATGSSVFAANALLQSPATASLKNVKFTQLCIASDGKDVVLLATDNKDIYAIDIADNVASEASANTITSVANFVAAKLTPVAGGAVTVKDMVVNPISKTVYIVATNATGSVIFKVKNAGASVTMLDLSNISHSKITWGGSANIMSMTYGNGTLYASSGNGSSALDGELAWTKAPFANNATVSKRATSMFKSNWGNAYLTDAPLETIVYGNINGKHRVMGVTTCAPGFSLDATSLTTGGVLQVTEDFNVNSGMPMKVVYMKHDGKNWLFNLHESGLGGEVYRIGEKYLDGSAVTANKYNKDAVELRNLSGARTSGLTDDDLRKMAGQYTTIAFWDDYRLLLLENSGGALKMLQVATSAPALGVSNIAGETANLNIYPNPANSVVNFDLPEGMQGGEATVYSVDGRIVMTKNINSNHAAIDIHEIGNGHYTLSIKATDGKTVSGKFIVQ